MPCRSNWSCRCPSLRRLPRRIRHDGRSSGCGTKAGTSRVLRGVSSSHAPMSIRSWRPSRDGFAGLEEQRTRPPQHPGNQLTYCSSKRSWTSSASIPVRDAFGSMASWRHNGGGAPSEATVGRAMALNRQFHGAPGPWASAQEEAPSDTTPKHLPYRPRYRHHMWFIDIRYLVRLDGRWVYSFCMLEGYSRKILAGMASPTRTHRRAPTALRGSGRVWVPGDGDFRPWRCLPRPRLYGDPPGVGD